MASVSSETTITLTPEEKELLEEAIIKIEEISNHVCWNTELFVDAESIFANLKDAYRQNGKKLPTVVYICE